MCGRPEDNRTDSGGQGLDPRAATRTIAWFDSYDEVRRVELDLERSGVDSVHITTQKPASLDDNEVDNKTAKCAATRTALGVGTGLLVGAVLGFLVGLVMQDAFADAMLFALGGAIFGVTAGFFYGFAINLPTDPEVLDTLGAIDQDDDSHWIIVEGAPEDVSGASAVLARHNPTELVSK